MPALPPLPARTGDQRFVFQRPEQVEWRINGGLWIDLYALLEVRRYASRRQLEDAIISRVADLLIFSVARGSSEVLNALDQHREEFRPILLNNIARHRYDEQLAWHETGDPRAIEYQSWVAHELLLSRTARVARQLKATSHGVWQRLADTFRDSEYL